MQQEMLRERVQETGVTLDNAVERLDVLETEAQEMTLQLERVAANAELAGELDDLEKRADAGFIMAIVSLVLCVLLSSVVICWQESRIRELETRALSYQHMEQPKKKKKKRNLDIDAA